MILASSTLAGKVSLTWDHYYNHDEVVDALNKLNKSYSNLTNLTSIGKSEEGRDIWMLQINNSSTGKDTGKPGIYVEGTIHGNEIQATEVCLYLAWYLLENYDSNPVIKDLIDTRAFYIVPIVNVDSRARFFSDPSSYNVGRTARVGYDDDRDGLVDEDDYDDLDGDGELVQMRIKDPTGRWKSDPYDPRVMIRVTESDQKGEYRMLGTEGIDNDGDGMLNEDTPGYLDMNRNYGFKWQPPYVQSGAGDFPMSAMPTRAVSQFVMSKPNIAFSFSYHNSGGMILRGPDSKLVPMYSPMDVQILDYLGYEAEKILPGYRYLVSKDDLYTVHGGMTEWMFSNLGIFAVTPELYMSSEERYRKPDSREGREKDDAWYGGTPRDEKMKFNDHLTHGVMFRDWKKFNHPQYGEVELGGWLTFTTRVPQKFQLYDQVHRNAANTIFVAQQTPEVKLELIKKENLGNGLKLVRVRAWNENAIPTLSHVALRKGITRKDIISIEGSGVEIVSGGIVQDAHFDRVQYTEHRPHMIFTSVPSFGNTDVQWIVRGSGKVTVKFDSIKATNRSLSIDL